jgi:hypothetical protein
MPDLSAKSSPVSAPETQRWRVFAAFSAALLLGCTDRPLDGDEAGATSTGQVSTTSTGADPTTSTSTSTSGDVTGHPHPGTATFPTTTASTTATTGPDTGMDTGDFTTSCGFICEPDLPPNGIDCPGTQQLDPECPVGHKCTIEESLGDTHCVEIALNPKGMYEPCTMMGHAWSGLDDCGLGMVCWGANERGEGTCVGLCDGSPDDCVCADPKAQPTWCQECAVGLCLPGCDPLLQDCDDDAEVCVPDGDDGFFCVVDASGDEGQANDVCEFVNVCDKGLFCADAGFAGEGCPPGSPGCCTPFCEFPGGACPNPDQQCVQFFDPMQLPKDDPQLAIGVCGVPQ